MLAQIMQRQPIMLLHVKAHAVIPISIALFLVLIWFGEIRIQPRALFDWHRSK
jgi:hypothetical protein